MYLIVFVIRGRSALGETIIVNKSRRRPSRANYGRVGPNSEAPERVAGAWAELSLVGPRILGAVVQRPISGPPSPIRPISATREARETMERPAKLSRVANILSPKGRAPTYMRVY
ncbi:unnamed protein product, partial [Iphiclides podalirius]